MADNLFDDVLNSAPSQDSSNLFDEVLKAPSFGNVQAGVSASPSFKNVQSGSDTTSTGQLGYYADKFTKSAGNLFDDILGVPEGAMEAGANFESQGLAIPAGGAARLGLETVNQLVPKALQPIPLPTSDEAQQAVTDAITYHPQTEMGKTITAGVQYPFEKLAEGADYLGQKTLDVTGSPALAASVNTAVQVVPMAILGKVGEAARPRAPRAAEAVVAAHDEAQAAGKPSWEATADALQAIQESDSRPTTGRPGDLNLSPEETRPPAPENADLGNEGNPSVKKTESKISESDSVQATKDADAEAAQRAAWGGDFSHLPDAEPTPRDELVSKWQNATSDTERRQAADDLAAHDAARAPTNAHPLFDDLVPKSEEPPVETLNNEARTSPAPLNNQYFEPGAIPDSWKQRAAEGSLKFGEVLDDVIDGKTNAEKPVRDYANYLKVVGKKLGGLDTTIEHFNDENVGHQSYLANKALKNEAPGAAYYSDPQKVIRVDPASQTMHDFLHEGTHAITAKAIEAGRQGKLTGQAAVAYTRLNRLFQVAKELPREGQHQKYGFTNQHEFVAELFGNPTFRDHLKSIPFKDVEARVEPTSPVKASFGRIRTLYDGVVNAVGRMLGLNPKLDSLLDASITSAHDLFRQINPADVRGVFTKPLENAPRISREDIDKQAQAALSRGANPEAVKNRQMDLYRQHGHEPAPTSTKNAVRDAERAAEGRDPIIKEAAQSHPAVMEAAQKAIEKNPNRPNEIIKNLTESDHRNVNTVDEGVLLIHKAALRNMRDDAQRVINDPNASDTAKFDARTTWGEMEAKINLMDNATEGGGSEWGRFGNFRRRQIRSDYSLDALEQKRRAVLGGRPLTPEEAKAVKADADSIAQAQKELDASQAKIQAAHDNSGVKYTYENLVKEMAQQLKTAKKKGTFLETLKKNADESRDWFKKNLSKSSAGVDPTAFFHLARIGAYHIANGAVKFADWVGKMKAELGSHFKSMKDSMPAVFKAAQEQHALGATETKPRLRAKKDLDPNNITHKDVYDLARAHVINGVHGEDAVMKAVHADLKDHGLSERDVRRLFSEYGEAKFPSKEADKKELREIRALVQMQESIDRINEGLPALKSGVQRDKATAAVREKRRQLNDLLKNQEAKNGMSPEKLVTYQEMRARNLRNQIEDLTKELETGEKKVRKPTPADSQEVTLLKAERDRLKDELKKIEDAKRQPAPSDPAHQRAWNNLEKQINDLEAKIKARDTAKKEKTKPVTSIRIEEYKQKRAALKQELDNMHSVPPKFPLNIHEVRNKARRAAIERQIESLDKQIAAGGEKLAKLKPSPDDAETKALKVELAAKQKQLKDLRDAKNPPPSPEEKYQAGRTKQLQRDINRIYDRIRADDYTKRKVEIKELNAENANLARKLYEAKNLFRRHQFEIEMSLRSPLQKLFGGGRDALQLARAVQTSIDLSATLRQGGFIFWGHPIRGTRALLDSIKAGRGEEFAFRVQHEIEHRENFHKYKASGLQLTFGPGHELIEQEEKFMSRWLEKSHYNESDSKALTVAKKAKDIVLAPTRASERAFRSYLNKLRADSFDTMLAAFARDGRNPTTVEMKAIADFINVATGRGHIGFKPQTAVGLNTVFFAPRLVGSRFNLLFGQPLIGKLAREAYAENRKMGRSVWESTRLHRMIGAEYARYARGVVLAISLAYLAHQAYSDPKEKFMETDIRSTDFGKFRFGNTWYDPWSGMAQVAALVGKLATRQTKTSKGKIKNLSYYEDKGLPLHEYGDQDVADVLFNFARKKLAPAPGALLNAVTGKNVAGQKTTPLKELIGLAIPLTFDTTYNAYISAGVPHATADTLADFFGVGVSVRNNNNQAVTKKEETDGR